MQLLGPGSPRAWHGGNVLLTALEPVLALASNSFRISDTLSHFGEALISESVR